ncbi:disease resistance protein RGA2-like [Solanum stenotomum]|uniref:disease resistance protein RGA2-like n=1 Tax=Solanum stenotomum TaxID=172797 RepID=UPI0020D0AD8F|nr:disease resistance protein RGA2-like [Solanum stenotomum]
MVPLRKILPIQKIDSVVVVAYVVGKDNDIAEIKKKILTKREDIDLCTIPIVGIGGLGKTTVAKRIFNDEQIEKHFEKRVRLCLPEMLEIKSFLELILKSLTERKLEVQSRDIIIKKLRDELAGRNEESLPNLVKLKLSGSKRCKEIPTHGELKFLRHLELVGFHKLECIGPALYGVEISNIGSSNIFQVFPSLKELVLEDISSLIEWKGVEVGVRMFPGLERLQITDCPFLKSILNQFEILRQLNIRGVDSEMPLLNLCNNLTSLIYLYVSNVKKLTCLPDEMLRKNVSLQDIWISGCGEFRELPQSLYNLHSLKRLQIDLPIGMLDQCRSLEFLMVDCCNNLVSFPLHVWEMPSLLHLCISQCPNLISVPEVGLHRLTRLWGLKIYPFSEIVDFDAFQIIFNGIQRLLSIHDLAVYGRGHWDSLPYQIIQLSNLREITIADFGIKAPPPRLDNLTSLERLSLVGCKRLQHLNFSDAMPKLRHLWISDYPLLEALSDGLNILVSLEDLYLQNYKKTRASAIPSCHTTPH